VGIIGPTTLSIEMSALGPVGATPPDKVTITITQPSGVKLTARYERVEEADRLREELLDSRAAEAALIADRDRRERT
jgi:hypothetical protein